MKIVKVHDLVLGISNISAAYCFQCGKGEVRKVRFGVILYSLPRNLDLILLSCFIPPPV